MALLSLLIVVTTVYAQGIANSAVTIDNAKGNKQLLGYRIDADGTVSLGANDIYQGFKQFFTSPGLKNVTPSVNLTPPSPGHKANWNSFVGTTDTGSWEADAELTYKDKAGNTKFASAPTYKFKVP